jgi:hypothetical protein
MMLEEIHCFGNAMRPWVLFVVVFFATNANVLGQGDVQGNSNLVEIRKAQITMLPSVSAEKTENVQHPDGAKPKPLGSGIESAPNLGETKLGATEKPSVQSVKRNKQSSGVTKPELSGLPAPGLIFDDVDRQQDTKPFGEFHLLLSLKLSMPENTPVPASNLPTNGGVPQQDSVAKEKLLSVLTAQIAEMEQMIKEQQSQLDISTSPSYSRVATSGVIAHRSADGNLSGINSLPGAGNDQPRPKIVAPDLRETGEGVDGQVELFRVNWVNLAIATVLVLLVVIGFVGYRKYKAFQHLKHPLFNDLSDVSDPLLSPATVQKTFPMNEQTIKHPVYDEKKSHSTTSDEYGLF